MKSYRKSSLAFAVSAVIGTAAFAPAANAISIDVITGLIEENSGGDTLLFPLYTTAVGAQTSFSTTNTGPTSIAAKIRFREQEHSMDVLDFIVVYSPYDKFDFAVSQGEGETRPVMRWNDSTCVIGPDRTAQAQAFPPPSSFVESEEQMQVGHVEMLGMANLDTLCWNGATQTIQPALDPVLRTCSDGYTNLGAAAIHGDDGQPANCDLLISALSSPQIVATINNTFGYSAAAAPPVTAYDVPNDLIGRYVVTDVAGGIEAGGDAIAIMNSNFMLSAQSPADCAEQGSVNCSQGYAWDAREFDHPHFGDMLQLATFQDILTATSVAGDWSNNPANFVGVDWIISFPSKYAYLGYGSTDCLEAYPASAGADPIDGAANNWCLLPATRPREDFGPVGNPDIWTLSPSATLDLCLTDADLAVYDAEENEASGNVSVSPGTDTQLDICPELGIYTLTPTGVTPRASVIQTAARRQIITFENLDAIRGWGRLSLPWTSPISGGAVNGLNFTTRATADPTFNNGSLTTLQKFAPLPAPPTP
jgi:hypothetical protein